jgi:hypothetical protein
MRRAVAHRFQIQVSSSLPSMMISDETAHNINIILPDVNKHQLLFFGIYMTGGKTLYSDNQSRIQKGNI